MIVNITVLSRRLGISPRYIRKLEEIGCFAQHVPMTTGVKEWSYRIADVDSWVQRTTCGRVQSLDDVVLA